MGNEPDILQDFLNNRLLDVGADDTRLDRVRQAAKEVAGLLRANREKVIRYALVAFDPATPADEPVFGEIAEVLAKHWNTYRSAFPDVPRTLYRAVTLAALSIAQKADTKIALAIALLARNMLPLLDLGTERSVWTSLVDISEELVAPEVQAEWGASVKAGMPKLDALPKPEKLGKLDRTTLQTKIEGAAGPHNAQSRAAPSPNPHWPNAGPPWSYEFPPRMTVAVADAVDAMGEAVMTARAKTDKALIDGLSGLMSGHVAALSRSSLALERRLRLLWWRESLYSTRVKTGYRTLPNMLGAAQMAVDLFHEVPVFCPLSVEYFLREAVVAVVGEQPGRGNGQPLVELISTIVKSDNANIRDSFATYTGPAGRRSALALIADGLAGQSLDSAGVQAALGIPGSTLLNLGDLSVWIFRELQVYAALQRKAS